MRKSGFVTQTEFDTHREKDWRVVHGIWANIRGVTVGPRPKGSVGPHTHLMADVTDTPWAWTDVLKAGSNLTDLATRQHAGLTNVTSDLHHAQLHAASHHQGAGDALKLDNLATPDDNTDLDFSTTLHGLVPKGVNLGKFLKDDGTWAVVTDATPDVHADTHEFEGTDEINHDALLNFVGAEHLPLPGTINDVLSDHDKDAHDGLGLDHGALSGKDDDDHSQYHNNTRGDIRYNTKAEITTFLQAQDELAEMSDVDLTDPADGALLVFNQVAGEWRDAAMPTHAATHDKDAGDQLFIDDLAGYEADEHLALPNSIAAVLSDHNIGAHTALSLLALPDTVANVLSNHTQGLHNALDISAVDSQAIDGVDVSIVGPQEGEILIYDAGDTRWENKPAGTPGGHYATHELGGGDDLSHDLLAAFVAAEHLSLPRTFADVINAGHTAAIHLALGSGAVAAGHGTGTTDMIINACYGTSATPPSAGGVTEGAIYLRYTA